MGSGRIDIPESKTLTVLLDENNEVFAYEGQFEIAVQNRKIIQTGYHVVDGIGKLIREKQKVLSQTNGNKDELIYLIKPLKKSSYGNVIDALDEALINDVKKYLIVEPDKDEIKHFNKS